MIDFRELWQLNRRWRQWMAANSEFVTPDTIDTLRYCRIECNEAADVELRNRLSKHPRNNGRDNTVYEELADALMLALTALPEKVVWQDIKDSDFPIDNALRMDIICHRANMAVYYNASYSTVDTIPVTALCARIAEYPGMNTHLELCKCWHRLAWKHASKAMDSYPEELK